MDYEKKYKNALKWARGIYPNAVGADREDLDHYFPELKESEDERIRKAILEFFELQDDNTTYSFIPKKDILAWLEKQGQVKESSILQHEGTHEDISCKENDNSLTREPKFKVGDTIINIHYRYAGNSRIREITDGKYIFDEGSYIGIEEQDSWELVGKNSPDNYVKINKNRR